MKFHSMSWFLILLNTTVVISTSSSRSELESVSDSSSSLSENCWALSFFGEDSPSCPAPMGGSTSTINCLWGTAEGWRGGRERGPISCALSLVLVRSKCSPELFLRGCTFGLGTRSCSRAFESELLSRCTCRGLSLGMFGWSPVLLGRGFTDNCRPLAGRNRMPWVFCRRGFCGIAGRWPNVLEVLVDGLVTG